MASSAGFVLLNKSAGVTSCKALYPLKKIFQTKRVGHAGTLDLRASGLIIAAVDRATRLLSYVEAEDKRYTFRLILGYETDTLEWDGALITQAEHQTFSRAELDAVLPRFLGDIDQIPPNYSAIKIKGHRASDLTLRGCSVQLEPRHIHIHSLKILEEAELPDGCTGDAFAAFSIECHCSKGTYIRALARDLGQALGSSGCVSNICRTAIGKITLDQALTSENITSESLVPPNQVLSFPTIVLSEAQMSRIRNGNWIPWTAPVENLESPENLIFVADGAGIVYSLCFYECGRILPKAYIGWD